jgi:hypothetical protein
LEIVDVFVGFYVLASDVECENPDLPKWRGLRDRAILVGPVRTVASFLSDF